jgi:hypothetical protein
MKSSLAIIVRDIWHQIHFKNVYRLLPVVPAPVYAIKHLLVDNSHNLIKESFPEDNKYWNLKLYKY